MGLQKERLILVMITIFVISIFINTAYSTENIKITNFICSTGIKNKRPVDNLSKFPNNIGKIYCFSKVRTNRYPTEIYHLWYYKNRLVSKIKLNVNYAIFRTWSVKYINSSMVGDWRIVVADKNLNPIAEKKFEIYKNSSKTSDNRSDNTSDKIQNENNNDNKTKDMKPSERYAETIKNNGYSINQEQQNYISFESPNSSNFKNKNNNSIIYLLALALFYALTFSFILKKIKN